MSQFLWNNCPEWGWDDFEVQYSSPQLHKQGPTVEHYVAISKEYHKLMHICYDSVTSSARVLPKRENLLSSLVTEFKVNKQLPRLGLDWFIVTPWTSMR